MVIELIAVKIYEIAESGNAVTVPKHRLLLRSNE